MVRNIISVSGSHLFQESGAIIVISGQPVDISGSLVVVQSGLYLASGLYVTSGVGVTVQSGVGVTVQSGVGVQVQSGVTVTISGQSISVCDGTYDTNLLTDILKELRKINIQLNLITGNEISNEELE